MMNSFVILQLITVHSLDCYTTWIDISFSIRIMLKNDFVQKLFWISRYCCITFQGIIGFQFLFMLPQESIFSSLEHFYLRIIWQRSLGLHSKHTKLINFLMWQRWRKINISNTIPTECPFIFTTLKCHIPIWLYGSVQ